MNFQPELAAKVMAGEKTVTRRLVSENPRSPWWRTRCALKPDRTYAVCPGRGKNAIGRVRITGVNLEQLGDLDDDEAFREGFTTKVEFVDAFTAINGSYDPAALVWRVEFEVVPGTVLHAPAHPREVALGGGDVGLHVGAVALGIEERSGMGDPALLLGDGGGDELCGCLHGDSVQAIQAAKARGARRCERLQAVARGRGQSDDGETS